MGDIDVLDNGVLVENKSFPDVTTPPNAPVTDKDTLRDAAAQALTDLAAIQSATNPTQAQLIAAVKKEAQIITQIIKAMRLLI